MSLIKILLVLTKKSVVKLKNHKSDRQNSNKENKSKTLVIHNII